MPALYRIPLSLESEIGAWLDLDLPMLLQHAGADSGRFGHITAKSAAGQPVAVQWLPSGRPSAIRGVRRGTLVIGPSAERQLDLFVRLDAAKSADNDEVKIKETADALEISVSGKPFVTYRFNTKDPEVPRPYFHPLQGPSGKTITQMGEVPGKKEKHFHHTALWIAHQNFAAKDQPACDNWQIGKANSSRIEHVNFEAVESGPLAARFVEKLNWLNVKGDKVLLAETRTVTVPKREAKSRVIDIDLTLTGQDVAVTLNKTPYHLLAARVLDAMLPAKGGAITNSEGKQNPADGAAAKWIDVSGKLEDEAQGVALFNHPGNVRQPTPCLQFSGQTIGLSPTHQEALTIEPGKELRFRARVLVHAGDVTDAKVGDEYEAYTKGAAARIGGPEAVRA